MEKYKRAPDIIVNSAGITKDGFLLRMKEEDFEKVVDVNLKGTFLVTQVRSLSRVCPGPSHVVHPVDGGQSDEGEPAARLHS